MVTEKNVSGQKRGRGEDEKTGKFSALIIVSIIFDHSYKSMNRSVNRSIHQAMNRSMTQSLNRT